MILFFWDVMLHQS